VDVTEDEANEYITATRERVNASIAALEAELVRLKARQEELKKVLYAKFGKGINLEE